MKKLLGLIGTITIAGSGIVGVVGNAPTPRKSNINYQQTNNLETLKRNKRKDNYAYNFGITTSILKINSIFHYVIYNNKFYFISKSNKVYEYNTQLNEKKIIFEITEEEYFISISKLGSMLYFLTRTGKLYEYNTQLNEKKIIFEIDIRNYSDDIDIIIINKNFYFNVHNGEYFKIYEYNTQLNEKKIIFEITDEQPYFFKNLVFNNKLYFGVLNKVYEYNPTTWEKKRKIVVNANKIFESPGVALNSKLYFGSSDGKVYQYDPATSTQQVVVTTKGPILSSGLVFNNKLYFGSSDGKVYEYDPATREQKTEVIAIAQIIFSPIAFNDKMYFVSADNIVYEYNYKTGDKKRIISGNKKINFPLFELNKKIYLCSLENGSIYEYEPLELIESDIINLQEQIRRGLYLYNQKQNPNSLVKNIEFNMNNLNYSDIELIKEEELPTQKVTEDICVGETEFENTLSTEQKFKTQSCKYTKQKINSIQIIKGINKRIDNTLETGTSNTDATSKTDTKTKTSSINVGAEVSVGWGPFSASVSTSVGNEESNTSQRESSQAKTKNISTIISDSSSFDLSNLKEEQELITNELEYPAQEITVGGNQTIKVIFNLNKIIKKYKITFKQNISGTIKAKIKDENDQIIEQEYSIKDIMLTLKENNLLPKEIIINNDLVSFLGELIVSKNTSRLKLKTEEIETI